MSNAEIFTRIFRNCEWNGDGVSTSVSGPGSTPTAAKTYVDLVLSFIKENGITSVVDIGHGDWFMWPDEAFRGITYTGFDVVEELCLNNTTKFGSETIKFVNQDATKVDLPTGDLILIKDVLGHLSLVDIQTILSKASRFKFIIINEGFSKIYVKDWVIIVRRVLQLRRRIRIIKQGGGSPFVLFPIFDSFLLNDNKEIVIGDHRTINLLKSPFNLSDSSLELVMIRDYPGHDFRIFGAVKRIWVLKSK